MIITIDGPAAAGKGTLATNLAKHYRLAYFDTGMVYRAVGLEMLLSQQDIADENIATQFAEGLTFPKMMQLSENAEFRSPDGGQAASIVSSYSTVRAALLKMQQDYSRHPVFADGTPAAGVVYDGRDTGTVVCPEANVKLFITASPEVRAERRYKEFKSKGRNISYTEVLADIRVRDDRDINRATAPLKPAADAIILDTSSLNIQEVIKKACEIIDSKQESS